MQTLLTESVRWITMPYSILLGVMAVYWLTVILGFLDLEVFDFDLDLEADVEVDSLLSFLNIGAVPFSIWLTIVTFQMWLYSVGFNVLLDNMSPIHIPDWLRFFVVLLILLPLAVIVAKYVTAPLNSMFEIQSITKNEFVGKTCIVTSSQVNQQFGTAEFRVRGTPQLLDVRAKSEDGLKRNDQALIYEYDADEDIFYVTRA
ncbi:hypothetical protein CSA56_06910 [candidate division KSB3 bacterium]|uniref:DUF1449 domain-containing protein n=1 Tax=candidate division KSB3 bacterium TaxID=2044937 RepID=A0A2G6KGE6_9BACT|nr:MAG: hypothetical protein CSA56_06910 [candidate division KSB3 bacterium]